MTVIERIDELRVKRGWSVNCLAVEAMLTQSTLNNMYVRKAEPKLSTLRAICAAFGITLSEFFAGMEEKETGADAELKSYVSSLSAEEKNALLVLFRARGGERRNEGGV